MSVSQNRKTFQPCFCNVVLTSLSRSIFRSILECQKSQLLLWSFFLISQFLPCQNSPSQNIAILWPLITKSGLPNTDVSFLRYLTPAFQSNFPNRSSSLVPLPLFAAIFLWRCSFVKWSIGAIWGNSIYQIQFTKILILIQTKSMVGR